MFYDTRIGSTKKKRAEESTAELKRLILLKNEESVKQIGHEIYSPLPVGTDHILPWDYPVVDEDLKVYVDTRGCVNSGGKPTNMAEYSLLTTLAELERAFKVRAQSSDGNAMMSIYTKVYIDWVGGVLNSRFSLRPEQSAKVKVLLAAYYICTTINHMDFVPDAVATAVKNQLIRTVGLPDNIITAALDDAEVIKKIISIEKPAERLDYVLSVISREEIAGDNIMSLTYNTLIVAVSAGSWSGQNGTARALAALEHPPALIALIIAASNTSFYDGTRIGRSVKALGRNEISNFGSNVRNYIANCDIRR